MINSKETGMNQKQIQDLIDFLDNNRLQNVESIKRKDIVMSEQSKLLKKMEGKLKNYQDEISRLKA